MNSKIGNEELRILSKAANILRSIEYFPEEFVASMGLIDPRMLGDDLAEIVRACEHELRYTERERVFINCVHKINYLICQAKDGELQWREVYDSVFSKEISSRMWQTGLMPDYYDPDGGYDDDVIAFYNAAYKKMREIKSE